MTKTPNNRSSDCPFQRTLAEIAAIPLWGEPITDPHYGDKEELADRCEYDLENDCYEPSADAEASWLSHAVELARIVLGDVK